jgi:hypothetical protein
LVTSDRFGDAAALKGLAGTIAMPGGLSFSDSLEPSVHLLFPPGTCSIHRRRLQAKNAYRHTLRLKSVQQYNTGVARSSQKVAPHLNHVLRTRCARVGDRLDCVVRTKAGLSGASAQKCSELVLRVSGHSLQYEIMLYSMSTPKGRSRFAHKITEVRIYFTA